MEKKKEPAKFGDLVSVNFTCRLEDGSVFDTSEGKAPVQLTIGDNLFIPSFEKSIIGMVPGEKKAVTITAEDIYGQHDRQKISSIPRDEFPKELDPEVGLQIQLQRNDGGTSYITVTQVNETTVTLDANHPLAGKQLFFDIELVGILKPGPNAPALYRLGSFLQGSGELEEAVRCYKKAVAIQPDLADAYFNMGVISHVLGKPDDAIIYYQKVLELNPNHLLANNNLGNVLRQSGRADEAMEYYQKALSINPDHADTYNNIGTFFQIKGELGEAIQQYQKAVELNPAFTEAFNNLGNIYTLQGEYEKAVQSYQKAAELEPDLASAQYNLALIRLLHGNFSEGWENYEWRFKTQEVSAEPNKFPYPLWDSSPLEGKTLLVYSEQGLGDEIMFSSCLPDVLEKARACVVECSEQLMPIFIRSFPDASIFNWDTFDPAHASALPVPDLKIPIGSLPKFFRPDLGSFPGRVAYLLPDKERVSGWKAILASAGQGLKVGISWRGGTKPHQQQACSLSLKTFADLFSVETVQFVNLQQGDCAEEFRELKETSGAVLHTFETVDPLKDLDEFAALLKALDLVISVDNTTAHLAGALGAPVWTLLPFVPDWRWLLNRQDSPWYPAMKLFRQPSPGDWETVLGQVKKELQDMTESTAAAATG